MRLHKRGAYHRAAVCSQSPRHVASAAQAQVTQTDIQLASTLAGVTSRILLHPVDCVKTRLQHLRGRRETINAAKVILDFVSREGIPGLYRGIVGSLVGVIPYSMLYMPSYELAQAQLGQHLGGKELLGLRHILAGAIAGLCGSLVKVPVDVVKKRLQAGLYPNFSVAVSSIARQGTGRVGPVLSFYTGWRSSIMYDVPYNAVQFTVLENVKRMVKKVRGEGLGQVEHVLVGALTGMITSILTEPLDVVKTRMMTQNGGGTVYRGWAHCVRTVVREEGITALWKGTLPRLVWVGASSAIWYGTYQAVRQGAARRRLEAELKKEKGQ